VREGILGEGKVSLIGCDLSSLVVDTLCKQAVEENAAVACFYFDFAAQEEQSPAVILGSVLRQVVSGLGEVPERAVKAFRDREKVIGDQALALSEIVEFLQDVSSSRCTSICIDALDECPAGHRVKLLDSLNQILQKSPGARIFLTGRPHIRGEVNKHLSGRATTIYNTHQERYHNIPAGEIKRGYDAERDGQELRGRNCTEDSRNSFGNVSRKRRYL